MAPRAQPTGVLEENDVVPEHPTVEPLLPRKYKYVWSNIIYYIYLHLAALYGLYMVFTSANIKTTIQAIVLINLGNLGITAGSHRLWAHRSYKARLPLRVVLLILQTLAFQNSAIEWAKDHRVHHKFSETDADPHNARRGFFFSHIGWLMCKKHADVREKGKGVDISDLTEDPLLHFQHKYYLYLVPFVSFVFPTFVPMYFWNETFVNAFTVNLLRYCISLHITWLVNSAAHMYGWKPFDKFINPSENPSVAILALGEGWHNYHHVFPWDYKTSELGKYGTNITTMFLNSMSYLGLAYDLKTVPFSMVRKRIQRTGDGTKIIKEKVV